MRQIFLLLLTALSLQGRSLATSYNLPTWEHLAETSEFIGLVECVTAGGIVARYRVTESWKGAAVGTEMNISQHVDVFEPQFPISLVGEAFLVFADKSTSYRISSITSGGGVPLWWRKIPVDLRCFHLVPLKVPFGSYLSSYLGARSGGLAQFKSEVTGFLRCGREEQELRLILAAARKELYLPDPTEPSSRGNEKDLRLYESLQGTKDVEELWKRIVGHASKLSVPAIPETEEEPLRKRRKAALLFMLGEGGRQQCEELLGKADPSTLPWDKKEVDWAMSQIRRNLSSRDSGPHRQTDPDANSRKPPTPDDIAKAKTLLSKPWDYQTGPAFELLCRHAPGSVVPYLLAWQPSDKKRGPISGYLIGSAFGHLCAVDRARHLKALQSAKDGWIRASAAVYLCFDERNEGEKALRKMAMTEGDAGAWAALVLASRGDKSSMLRALEVMATPDDGGMRSTNHRNLQKRLRVLLSNVANASGVSQPPSPPKEYPDQSEIIEIQKQWHEGLVSWWRENQEKIILVDPWAGILEEQRVD